MVGEYIHEKFLSNLRIFSYSSYKKNLLNFALRLNFYIQDFGHIVATCTISWQNGEYKGFDVKTGRKQKIRANFPIGRRR